MERLAKDMTAQAMIEELKRIKQAKITVGDTNKHYISKRTNEQNIILKKLNINI